MTIKVSPIWKPLATIFISVFVFFLFKDTFHLGFIFDDWGELENAKTHPWPLLFQRLLPTSSDWRVMYYFWWKAIFVNVGVSPIPYHVLHFIQHLVCTLWVFFLVRLFSKNERAALIAALFFSFHKAMSVTVAWDSSIIDSFIVLFGIPTIFFYVFATESKGKLQKLGWYFLCYVFSLFTLKSKLAAITFPALLIYYEMLWGGRGWIKNTVRRQWPIWGIYLIFVVAMIPELRHVDGGYERDLSLFGYWKGLLWYVSSAMPQADALRTEAYRSLFPISVLAIFTGLSLYFIKTQRAWIMGLLWFLTAVFPMAILVTHHFDHHLYFLLVAASLLVGLLVDLLLHQLEKWPWLQWALGGALFGFYFWITDPFYQRDHSSLIAGHLKNERTLADLQALQPPFPDNTHFYFNRLPDCALMDSGVAVRLLWNKPGIRSSVILNPADLQAAIHGNQTAPEQDRFDAKTEHLMVMDYNPDTGAVTDVTTSVLK